MKNYFYILLLFSNSFFSFSQDLEKNLKAIDAIEKELDSYCSNFLSLNTICVVDLIKTDAAGVSTPIFTENIPLYDYKTIFSFSAFKSYLAINEESKSDNSDYVFNYSVSINNFSGNVYNISKLTLINNTLTYTTPANDKLEIKLDSKDIDINKDVQFVAFKLRNPIPIKIKIKNDNSIETSYTIQTDVVYCLIYKNNYTEFENLFYTLMKKHSEKYNQ